MTDAARLSKDLGTEKIIWNLTDLYPATDSKQFNDDVSWCERESLAIGNDCRGTIEKLSAKQLFDLVYRIEHMEIRLGKLCTFAFLHFITQVDNEQAGALYQTIHELVSTCTKETVFFELEWNKLDDDCANTLLKDPQLAGYHHYLQSMRRYRPHQLLEVEERLLIETKAVGRKSWTTLFEKVIGQLRFGERGRTEEEVLSDLYHQDRTIRAQAADDLTAGLK
ncbi:MAG: oligoendopeptidase F, partial [Deltaproteobacteria bacterium]|nr:oligoendopeptidase F [Deltaproteobacteria bacterium]